MSELKSRLFVVDDVNSMPRSNDDPRRHVQVLPEQVGAVSQILALSTAGLSGPVAGLFIIRHQLRRCLLIPLYYRLQVPSSLVITPGKIIRGTYRNSKRYVSFLISTIATMSCFVETYGLTYPSEPPRLHTTTHTFDYRV